MSSNIRSQLTNNSAQTLPGVRPSFPSDLNDQVIEEIARGIQADNDFARRQEVRSNLRNCSLVCHSWLYSSRRHISFIIRESTMLGFIQHCVDSPLKFLPLTIRRLVLRGTDLNPILPFLHEWPLLRSLEFWISVPEAIPILPSVVEVTLHRIQFPDWTGLVMFLANFPSLQHFRESIVIIDQISVFPGGTIIRDLKSLYLSSEPYLTRALTIVPHPLVTEELQLEFPSRLGSTRVELMSAYLRKLDSRLKHLHLFVPRSFRLAGVLTPLDVRSSISIERLTVDHFVQCRPVNLDEIDVEINPDMAVFLFQVLSQRPIQHLVFEVLTLAAEVSTAGLALHQFSEQLKASPHFSDVRSITFYIGDRFRVRGAEYWPSHLRELLRTKFLGEDNQRRGVCFEHSQCMFSAVQIWIPATVR